MAMSCKGAHCPQEILLTEVRWYVASPVSTHHVAARMQARGVSVDHAPITRWVAQDSPQREESFPRHKRLVWTSWRLDETSRRVPGEGRYVSRAVDKQGQTLDVLLTAHRDAEAALQLRKQAMRRHGVPEKMTRDGTTVHAAVIKSDNEAHGIAMTIRKGKY